MLVTFVCTWTDVAVDTEGLFYGAAKDFSDAVKLASISTSQSHLLLAANVFVFEEIIDVQLDMFLLYSCESCETMHRLGTSAQLSSLLFSADIHPPS